MTTRLLDPLALERSQIMQVFDKGKIRSESEQVAFLEAKQKPTKKKVFIEGQLRPDHNRHGLVMGRKFFHADEVLTALSSLNSEPDETGETSPVAMDSAHLKCLKIQAAKRDTSIRELVVRACRAAGLFTEE